MVVVAMAVLHLILLCRVQEERPIKTPEVEEFSDDLYRDEHNELLVSTVTVGPNITDFEVCALVSVSVLFRTLQACLR